MALAAAVSLAGFYLAFRLVAWPDLPVLAGLGHASFPAQLAILALVATVCAFILTPAGVALSRFYERQADRFAVQLTGHPEALASAQITLCAEKLANLPPHFLFAWFAYSHPPVVERIQTLRTPPARNMT